MPGTLLRYDIHVHKSMLHLYTYNTVTLQKAYLFYITYYCLTYLHRRMGPHLSSVLDRTNNTRYDINTYNVYYTINILC